MNDLLPIYVTHSLLFVILFSIALFAFIIVRRMITKRRDDRAEARYLEIERDVLHAISTGSRQAALDVGSRYASRRKVLTQVLIDILDMIGGSGGEIVKAIFETCRPSRQGSPHQSRQGPRSVPDSGVVRGAGENGRRERVGDPGIARYPLFCAIDADSMLDRDALLKVVRPFHEDPERTVGVGGVIRLSNGCLFKNGQVCRVGMPRNALARFQILEYLRAFLGGRMGMSMMNCLLIISGAFGLFRKDVALKVGGYRKNAIGEDLDLVVRLRRYLHEQKTPYRITFIPDPICWTEAPEKLRILASQRNRWHRGLVEVLSKNLRMIFNPRYGMTGMVAMPFYAVFEMLGPLIELSGYLMFAYYVAKGQLNSPFAVRFFLLSVVCGMLLSLTAILLEEYSLRRYPRLRDIIVIAAFGILENLGYRQWLSVVRVKGFWDYFRGNIEWGAMEKKGFALEQDKP